MLGISWNPGTPKMDGLSVYIGMVRGMLPGCWMLIMGSRMNQVNEDL